MTSEQIVLLGLLISSLVIVIGWAVTASIRRRNLREKQKSQQLERELAVFRESLATFRGMTSSLLDHVDLYHQLIALLVSGQFSFESGAVLIEQLNAKGLKLVKILYDPAFRSISDLLPEDHAERLHTQLKKASEMASEYQADASSLSPITPRLDVALREFADQALKVSRELI